MQAQEALEKACRFAHKYHFADLHERAKGLQALYQLSAGKIEAVARWVKSSGWDSFDPVWSGPFFNLTNYFMHPADIDLIWRSRPNIKRWARCLNGGWAMPNCKIGWA